VHRAVLHAKAPQLVMAGLVPAISLSWARLCLNYRDRRDKPGDDERE
jgi:hypothetical protein